MVEQLEIRPPAVGPWWVMGEDEAGQVWVMKGPVTDWGAAAEHVNFMNDAATPRWCFWLWTLEQIQANSIKFATTLVIGA